MCNKYKTYAVKNRTNDSCEAVYGRGEPRYDDRSFSCSGYVRQKFSHAFQASGLSCRQIADEVNRLCGAEVEPGEVKAWAAAGTCSASIPLHIAGALAIVLDDVGFVRAAFRGVPGLSTGGERCTLNDVVSEYGISDPVAQPKGHLVRAWMSANRYTTATVAAVLGVSPVAIRRWILGTMRSARIRQWFLENGCPVEILGEE